MTSIDWIKLIGGGFAHMTAPFAVHPLDKARAKEYLKAAQKHGLTIEDALAHAREYLENANGSPVDIENELLRVRKFIGKKLRSTEVY